MKHVIKYRWVEMTADHKPLRELVATKEVDLNKMTGQDFVYNFIIGGVQFSGTNWVFDVDIDRWVLSLDRIDHSDRDWQPESVFNKRKGWEVETKNMGPTTERVYRFSLFESDAKAIGEALYSRAHVLGQPYYAFSKTDLKKNLLALSRVAGQARKAFTDEQKKLAGQDAPARFARLLAFLKDQFGEETGDRLLDAGQQLVGAAEGDLFIADGKGGAQRLPCGSGEQQQQPVLSTTVSDNTGE